MVLKREEILKEIKEGRIIINPFDDEMVQDSSIELSLGSELGLFGELKKVTIVDISSPPKQVVFPLRLSEGNYYDLEPKNRVVGKTKEKVTLPSNLCGWITPRARKNIYEFSLGISSGFVQPGTANENLFFLITNVGRVPVRLHSGIKIVQLILIKLQSEVFGENSELRSF